MSGITSKKLRTRGDYRFHLEYRTRWRITYRSDNDMYGHLNNSIYAFLIDSIINHYLITHCGIDPSSSSSGGSSNNKHNQIGLVVSSYCDYFASVGYPDVLELGLRVVKLGSSSVMYEVGVFKQSEDAVKAVGGFTHVFVERDTMKPRGGMATDIREGLEKLRVGVSPKL
ncbi:hypothetical protein UA08_06990 [Talaromyces atroroseus]|uniref:Thioesterase domain-containing protein n=1 Tax=Talaromyces atroroseus TaxID=1441469 RepID=A0A225A9X4_TALAT|nr:hypothetical protein UA08_06990 [Talaromyces atroroseus]OKL57602.1 hypothetical protein UA08_06990 [Talaromyces atroroseus]